MRTRLFSRWWIEITGKGSKTRLVPATNELMVELARYRRSLGMPPFPVPHEMTPLLLPAGWHAPQRPVSARQEAQTPRPLTRVAVHVIVKSVFEQSARRLQAQGEKFQSQAELLRAASAHWLRHTAGSRMADSADLRHVRDTLGHASISTTSVYLHAEDDWRHQAIEAGHRLGWD